MKLSDRKSKLQIRIANKKPPAVADANLARVLRQVYDDINELVNAVNRYTGTFDEWQGKHGDIRVTEKGLQYKDTNSWVTVPIQASQMSLDTSNFSFNELNESTIYTVEKALRELDDAF